MRQYLDLLKRVLQDGDPQYNERTGQLMLVSSGDQSIYDLREGFPRSTTKSSASMRWVAEEIFWMLRGERNAKTLYDRGVDIWNRNAYQHYLKNKGLEQSIRKNTQTWEDSFSEYQERMKQPDFPLEEADLGPVYGFQWRNFGGSGKPGSDQVQTLLEGMKKDKGSRYHLLSAWNPVDLKDMALGPCHCIAQFTVTRDRDLDVNMWQRSCDSYLGVPFNIMQYSLLNMMVAQETGLTPRKFIHSYGNVHVYAGVPPRSHFLRDEDTLKIFQNKIKGVNTSDDFLDIRDWYLKDAGPEDMPNLRKDHIPFVLEQLSKSPGTLPQIKVKPFHFFELIEQPAKEVIELIGGDKPQKWDSKAVIAA